MASRKIFVVGTGRSGTHWLARILDDHPDVRSTVEKPAIFDRATAAGLDFGKKKSALRYLRFRYTFEHLRSLPKSYVDKSHPNLWHVDELARMFPRARFVAIRRSVYGTVASMMLHRGVLGWQLKWQQFPVPNAFLGITTEIAETYSSYPVAAQCALRWKAHSDRIDMLLRRHGERMIVVEYEDLVSDHMKEAHRVWACCGLRPVELHVEVKSESRDKWRDQLSPEDILAIDAVLARDDNS